MIYNPHVGMRVYIRDGSFMDGSVGSISYVYRGIEGSVSVRLDNPLNGIGDWYARAATLSPVSAEDQAYADDQQRRQEHAMRYL